MDCGGKGEEETIIEDLVCENLGIGAWEVEMKVKVIDVIEEKLQ